MTLFTSSAPTLLRADRIAVCRAILARVELTLDKCASRAWAKLESARRSLDECAEGFYSDDICAENLDVDTWGGAPAGADATWSIVHAISACVHVMRA